MNLNQKLIKPKIGGSVASVEKEFRIWYKEVKN